MPIPERIRPTTLLAVLLSLAVVAASFALAIGVLEGLPHIEDEMAYDWQARLVARGKLTVDTPPICPKCFLVPFVVDHQGQRFGKYPPGWPAVLAFGHLPLFRDVPFARSLINPLLAGASIWLTFLLVRKLLDEKTAALAALLLALSPLFLMNSALLLSHAWSLFLTLSFCLGWLDAFTSPNERLPGRWRRALPALAAAGSMGLLALTRPMTALAVAVPFAIHGLWMLYRGPASTRLRLVTFGLIAGALALLVIVWQWSVTGDPFLNPYTLWWPYDRVGFGPGHGLQPGGFQPRDGYANTLASLYSGAEDLFGWMGLSYLFVPFGLIALRKNRRALLVSAVLPALIAAYFMYWMSASLVGPRYYYEGIFSAVLLTAAGIRWLAGVLAFWKVGAGESRAGRWRIPPRLWRSPLVSLLVLVVTFLVIYNMAFFMPARFAKLYGLYGVSRQCYQAFETPQARRLVPALVAVPVEKKWIEYGCMLDLTSPFFDSDFVLIVSAGFQKDQAIVDTMPGRRLVYFYPGSGRLIEAPRKPEQIRE